MEWAVGRRVYALWDGACGMDYRQHYKATVQGHDPLRRTCALLYENGVVDDSVPVADIMTLPVAGEYRPRGGEETYRVCWEAAGSDVRQRRYHCIDRHGRHVLPQNAKKYWVTATTPQRIRWAEGSFEAATYGNHVPSRFRGVYTGVRALHGRRWTAYICHSRKSHYLGTFDDEEEAAKAYDAAARQHFGAQAQPNFPADECCICLEECLDAAAIALPCSHRFHRACMQQVASSEMDSQVVTRSGVRVKCPICRGASKMPIRG